MYTDITCKLKTIYIPIIERFIVNKNNWAVEDHPVLEDWLQYLRETARVVIKQPLCVYNPCKHDVVKQDLELIYLQTFISNSTLQNDTWNFRFHITEENKELFDVFFKKIITKFNCYTSE